MTADTASEDMFRNLRREERKATNWIAKIRFFDGNEIATSIKDISASGARLAIPESIELPERFMFRVIGHDFVCAVRVAWRRGSQVGVRIERVGKLEAKPVKPQQVEASPETADAADPQRLRRSRISHF